MRAEPKRRLLIPEVIQASNMDCGPASLKCFLQGFGIDVSYERLRDACQTDVDGTLINTLEELARELGLEAAQIMLPVDHLLTRASAALPAIAVVRLPNGNNHFVVVWNRVGRFLQIMNPAAGRVWKGVADFGRELYIHTATIPATVWREWASSDEFLRVLRIRLAAVGIGETTTEAAMTAALGDPSWRSIARLDAAARALLSLTESNALRRGEEAERMFRQWLRDRVGDGGEIPASYWCVSAAGADQLAFRGAVLVHGSGRRDIDEQANSDRRLSNGLLATKREQLFSPLREILRMLREDGLLNAALLSSIWAITSCELLIQALLLRSIFSIASRFVSRSQLAGGMFGLLALTFLLLLDRLASAIGVFRYGRLLEFKLRTAFLHKLPHLGDRYYRTRLTADMAERGHSVHGAKNIPFVAARLVTSLFELILTTAGIIWIEPRAAPLAIGAAMITLGLPLVAKPLLTERDLRVRTHVGALGRFYLDAMMGLTTIRAHAAEHAIRKEQRVLINEWTRATFASLRGAVTVEAVQALVSTAAAAAILIIHLSGRADAGGSLLLIYWALNVPILANVFADSGRRYPESHNIVLRLMEVLRAEEPQGVPDDAEPASTTASGGVAIELQSVVVRAGGHTILDNITLSIEPGEHVAIIGASGAGKSSILSVILGWYTPSSGNVLVDGRPLDAAVLAQLRDATAWADPSVQIWDAALFDNIIFGASRCETFAEVIHEADLIPVIQNLPQGLQTRLGEGGRLLSGGEGQRVRLARALSRRGARLVILDEAFRGLDRGKRLGLMRSARKSWSNATMLYVTHDISHTEDYDRIVIVDHGQIVESGHPGTLQRDPSSHYALLLAHESRTSVSAWRNDHWKSVRVDGGEIREQK